MLSTRILLNTVIAIISRFTQYWVKRGASIREFDVGDSFSFGYSVSMNALGDRVAVGSPNNCGFRTNSGAVRVYSWNSSSWAQLGQTIYGATVVESLGFGVSLNASGDRMVIGIPNNDNTGTNSGCARVFSLSGSQWTKLGQDINGITPSDLFGYSVSMNGDGNIIAVGALLMSSTPIYVDGRFRDTQRGEVRFFSWNGVQWVQLGQTLFGRNQNTQQFGRTVSLNSAGNVAAIGSPYYGTYAYYGRGIVDIYYYDGTSWIQRGQSIAGENEYENSSTGGSSVSLNAAGDRVAIGSINNSGNGAGSGHVRVYGWNSSNSTWVQLGSDIDGEAAGDNSGYSVSLNAAGDRVAIGAPGNSKNGLNSGQARIYSWDGSAWVRLGVDIDGDVANDQCGFSVSLNAAGDRVAVGVPNPSDQATTGERGRAVVYFLQNVAWTINASSPESEWTAIAMSADGTRQTAVVRYVGIYTSTNSGITWTLNTSAPGYTGWTAIAVSADGTKQTALAGESGKIYTSTNSGVTWTMNSNAPGHAWYSVAMSTDGTKQTAVARQAKMYTSTDSGVTWTERNSAPIADWRSVAMSADGTKQTAAALGGNICTSTDSGVTWVVNNSAPVANWRSVAMSADGTRQTAVTWNGAIYTSTDSGVTWIANNSAPVADWRSVAMSADGTTQTAIALNGKIYTSTDSGANWAAEGSSPIDAWNALAMSADGTKQTAGATNSWTPSSGKIYNLI